MATTKNDPTNTSNEQRGQANPGTTTGRSNPNTQPGDRATNEETRNAGLPGTQRKGAETTQMGTKDRNTDSSSSMNTKDGDRTDREVAASRTTGQDPTGARDTNDGELRDEDEEDNEALPGTEDVEVDTDDAVDTDKATADDDATTTATK